MALAREKRLPPLHLSLNVPSRPAVQEPAFRHANPPLAAPPSASSTPLARSSQFRLADFDRLAVLGRGNRGTVYKVRHRETGALYALKVLHQGDAAEEDILGRTASPFVVRCHSVQPAASGDVALLPARRARSCKPSRNDDLPPSIDDLLRGTSTSLPPWTIPTITRSVSSYGCVAS